jgi:hypothetical protein
MKILYNHTQRASKITSDNATTNVPIFAHQTTDKYAKLNPKNIIQTSLSNPHGLNSIIVEISAMKNKINERLDTNTNKSRFVNVVYTFITTNLISRYIVKNHIAETQLACPLIPSIQLIALIHSIDQITKNITKNRCGIFHTKSPYTNSCHAQIFQIYTAKIAHHICAKSLTI